MNRLLCLAFLSACVAVAGSDVRDLHIEYRKGGGGYYSAWIRNTRNAAATAYIVQATFEHGGHPDATAFGGDTLGYAGGFDALPPSRDTDTGHTLPDGSMPVGANIAAAIFADGTLEGDENVTEMLLSGRQRAYADLKASLPKLQDAAAGKIDDSALRSYFESMKSRDMTESANLDRLIQIPGIRHRYFMGAVPMQALKALQAPRGGAAVALLAQFREWEKRLAESKPDIK